MEHIFLSKNALLSNEQPSTIEMFGDGLLDGAVKSPATALSQIGQEFRKSFEARSNGANTAQQGNKSNQSEAPSKKSPASNLDSPHLSWSHSSFFNLSFVEKNTFDAYLADHAANSQAYQLGTVVGSVVPFAATSLLTRRAATQVFGKSELPTLSRVIGENAATGFLMGGLLTPSRADEGNFAKARVSQAVNSALVFGTMGGTAHSLGEALSASSRLQTSDLARRLIISTGSGLAGGLVDAELANKLKATPSQLLMHAASYAAFGTVAELSFSHFSGCALAKSAECMPSRLGGKNLESDYQQILAELEGADVNLAINTPEPVRTKRRREASISEPVGTGRQSGESLESVGNSQHVEERIESKNGPSIGEDFDISQRKKIEIKQQSDELPRPEHIKDKPSQKIKEHVFALEKAVKSRLLSGFEMTRYRENVLLELKQLSYLESGKKTFNLHSVLLHMPGLTDAQRFRIADVLTLINKCTVNGGLSAETWTRTKSALAEQLKDAREHKSFSADAEEKILLKLFSQIKTTTNEPLRGAGADYETVAYANQIMRRVGYSQSAIQTMDAKLAKSWLTPAKNNIVSEKPEIANYAQTIDVEAARVAGACESRELLNKKLRDAAEYHLEKQAFDRKVDEGFVSNIRLSRISYLEAQFEKLGHDAKEKSRFYWELNRIMDPQRNSKFSSSERYDLMEQVLNHAAFPSSVHQGLNNTCNVAVCESRIYRRSPHQMARMVADIAETGNFQTLSGAVIDLENSASGLRPDSEARKSLSLQNQELGTRYVKVDGDRDWASQLVQTTLVKIRQKDRVETFDMSDRTMFDEDKLVFDENYQLRGMVRELKDILPVVRSNGKANDAPQKGVTHYVKSGLYLREVDAANLLYDRYSEIIGCVADTHKVNALYDQFGRPAQDFSDSVTNLFDRNGKLVLFQNVPGTIGYDKLLRPPSFAFGTLERERMHVTNLGRKFYIYEWDRFGKYHILSGPAIMSSHLFGICQAVNQQEKQAVTFYHVDGAAQKNSSLIEIANLTDLHQQLMHLKEADQFPAIVQVDVRNAPWYIEDGGAHVLNIRNYFPQQGVVKLTNQWGDESNTLIRRMTLSDLLQAMKFRTDLNK